MEVGGESGQEGERPRQIESHGRGLRAGSDFPDQRDAQRTLGPARGLHPSFSPCQAGSRALRVPFGTCHLFSSKRPVLPQEGASHTLSESQTWGPGYTAELTILLTSLRGHNRTKGL